MKKLLGLLVSALGFLASSAQAQLPPYATQGYQADVSGTFFWGRFFFPTNPSSNYIFVHDGSTMIPGLATLGTGLTYTSNGIAPTGAPGINFTSGTLNISLSSGDVTTALGYTPYNASNPAGYITSSALSGYATTTALSSGLAGKFNNPAGTTAQYVRGDGSLATLPSASLFDFSQPAARTLALSTSYQASNTAKAAYINISPSCGATLSLTGGSTCSMEARQGTSALTCSTGTVVKTWTNGNTGTLTIGLNTVQTISAPSDLKIPIGGYFILCPLSGTFTITATEQSAG